MVTKPPLNRSKTYERAMWLLRLAELNCVTTKIRSNPELIQFEIGTSTRRYLPASDTAGLARSRVSGKSRVPAPPPRMTANIRFMLTILAYRGSGLNSSWPSGLVLGPCSDRKRQPFHGALERVAGDGHVQVSVRDGQSNLHAA